MTAHARIIPVSPLGPLTLTATAEALLSVRWGTQAPASASTSANDPRALRLLVETERQLIEYFSRRRRAFDLPLAAAGTEFQCRVWRALREIPFGERVSYRDIAVRIGAPTAMRAVGAANGRNPIPVIVPCHRVVGADGSLTGFSGGLDLKRTLLALEAHQAVL